MGENLQEIPEGYAVLIELDTDFDPATSVDWPEDETREYVAKFESGELTAYGVSLVRLNADGNVICERYSDGSMGPARLASLWGCDVESGSADNVYTSLKSITDDHLRAFAGDIVSEGMQQQAQD